MWEKFSVMPTPVDALDVEEVACAECGGLLRVEAYYDGVDSHYCESCMTLIVKITEWEAEDYAKKHCKITRPLPKYYPEYEFRCTPEAYEMGDRESYTRNSHMCHCRHCCTNYDALIKPLDRYSVEHQIYYRAIYDRIYDLLEEAIENMDEGDDEF